MEKSTAAVDSQSNSTDKKRELATGNVTASAKKTKINSEADHNAVRKLIEFMSLVGELKVSLHYTTLYSPGLLIGYVKSGSKLKFNN